MAQQQHIDNKTTTGGNATTPPTSPPCVQDRLFHDLAKYKRSPHATQLLPEYGEFNFGQGDPLLQAAIDHWKVEAAASSGSNSQEKIVIEDKGSFRRSSRQSGRRSKQKSMPNMSVFRQEEQQEAQEVDHLIEHGTTFAGLGMNDIVHVDKDHVLSVPCVPPEMMRRIKENKAKSRNKQRRHSMPELKRIDEHRSGLQDHLEDHGSSVAGIGMNDIVHLGKDEVVSVPVLPLS